MAQQLRFFPQFERHSQVVELGVGAAARSFRIVAAWSRKECAWFLSIYESDGTALVENARVSPGSTVLEDMDRLHPTKPRTALIAAIGPEPYNQLDLGGVVKVIYFLYADIPVAAGDGTVFVVGP